jgi:UDP-glucuronate decarboxylase
MHVDDAAAALVALLMAEEVGGPVNIASGEPVPVRELVEAVADAAGRPELVGWGEIELGAGEPPLLAGDPARLRDEVGFVPRRALAEGIAETVAWWRERLSAS